MAEFTSILGKDFQNGVTYKDWCTPDARCSLHTGYKYASSNWVLCIKFVLPTSAKNVTLTFCSAEKHVIHPTMRYKFTTCEDVVLANATSEVEGDGSFTLDGRQYGKTTVTIDARLSAGTHYMYIWTNDSTNGSNYMVTRWYNEEYGFSASYEELDGLVYIQGNESVDAYQEYIMTANGAEAFVPYIFNGTSWDMCT